MRNKLLRMAMGKRAKSVFSRGSASLAKDLEKMGSPRAKRLATWAKSRKHGGRVLSEPKPDYAARDYENRYSIFRDGGGKWFPNQGYTPAKIRRRTGNYK